MKKTILLFSVGLMFTLHLNSAVSIATNNGDWSASSTWDCNQSPGNYDTMWVPVGFTVTVDINSPEYQGMLIIVDGTMYFDNGQKINICNGGVYVSSTGVLAGDNPGSKINICGQTVWVGPDSTYGPVSYGNVTLPSVLIDFNGQEHLLENGSGGTGTGISAGIRVIQHRANENENERIYESPGNSVITIYPNPSSGTFTINLSGDPNSESGTNLIQIFDATGALVFEEISANNGQGGFNVVINEKGELAAGIYLVRAGSGNEFVSQHIVIR